MMKVYWPFLFIAVALVVTQGLPTTRAQGQTRPQAQDIVGQPKLIKSPVAPYPEEAQKKNIEGKVELSVVVDERGRVADAKILSGPQELYQAAIDSVKGWEFDPPIHAPVETRVKSPMAIQKNALVRYLTLAK